MIDKISKANWYIYKQFYNSANSTFHKLLHDRFQKSIFKMFSNKAGYINAYSVRNACYAKPTGINWDM